MSLQHPFKKRKVQFIQDFNDIPNQKAEDKIEDETKNGNLIETNQLDKLSHNYVSGSPFVEIKVEENQDLDLGNRTTLSRTKVEGNKTKRTDDERKQAFNVPIISLKKYFKRSYGIDCSSFNCYDVLGTSIRYMKLPLESKIYQLFFHYPDIKAEILNVLKSPIPNHEKMVLKYFLTRTYEEVYKRYISGDINFPIFPNGTLRICQFMTLKKKIAEKEEEHCDKNEIDEFVELSKNLIEDIKSGNLERTINKRKKGKAKNNKKTKRTGKTKKNKKITKPFIPIVIKEFEDMRNLFNEDFHYEEIRPEMGLEEHEV